jgi:hypothetical protein
MSTQRLFLILSLIVACGSNTDGNPGDSDQTPAAGGSTGSGGGPAMTGGSSGQAGDSAQSSSGSAGVLGSGGSLVSGGGAGGSSASAGASGSGGSSGAGSGSTLVCNSPVGPGLPKGAPALTKGTWVDISPPNLFDKQDVFTQGVAVDPCNPAVLYLGVCAFDVSYGGLYKSIDAGKSWNKVGKLDEPIRIRIDPKDTQHLYVVDGVRGGTEGFWISHDGGATFTKPQSFIDLPASNNNMFIDDLYDVAVDPTDFDHALLSSHQVWGVARKDYWNGSAGILETKDGGKTWIVHQPQSGWGAGHAITFLYNPELKIGDKNTWLLGTQGNGLWRTTDAGQNWTKVSDNSIQHGGGTVHYTKTGVLYATGGSQNMMSTDNGLTWTGIGPGGGYNGIGSDGTHLYTAKCFADGPFITSLETDGKTWSDFNAQKFHQGPFEFARDATNGILYAGNWGDGMWALAY